jgi:ParB-like chromosome segregation protein Spo0J|tara:strand:- start:3323 stop:3976 length:654 start_codon:yes stop_codon:yes gene_type:complete
MKEIKKLIKKELKGLNIEDTIKKINEIKLFLHSISPFKNEPTDCVIWIKNNKVFANDYNPNVVAPPEMELLNTSIKADGFTQPIVTYVENNKYVVVDGFHRNRVGREIEDIKKRLNGYLPLTVIRDSQFDRGDRISSTIRHNRARGKHKVEGMSEIVLELKRRNWSDKKIAKNLGMDSDEILRLCQITGLREMFNNESFSLAWEVDSDNLEIEEGES